MFSHNLHFIFCCILSILNENCLQPITPTLSSIHQSFNQISLLFISEQCYLTHKKPRLQSRTYHQFAFRDDYYIFAFGLRTLIANECILTNNNITLNLFSQIFFIHYYFVRRRRTLIQVTHVWYLFKITSLYYVWTAIPYTDLIFVTFHFVI